MFLYKVLCYGSRKVNIHTDEYSSGKVTHIPNTTTAASSFPNLLLLRELCLCTKLKTVHITVIKIQLSYKIWYQILWSALIIINAERICTGRLTFCTFCKCFFYYNLYSLLTFEMYPLTCLKKNSQVFLRSFYYNNNCIFNKFSNAITLWVCRHIFIWILLLEFLKITISKIH